MVVVVVQNRKSAADRRNYSEGVCLSSGRSGEAGREETAVIFDDPASIHTGPKLGSPSTDLPIPRCSSPPSKDRAKRRASPHRISSGLPGPGHRFPPAHSTHRRPSARPRPPPDPLLAAGLPHPPPQEPAPTRAPSPSRGVCVGVGGLMGACLRGRGSESLPLSE